MELAVPSKTFKWSLSADPGPDFRLRIRGCSDWGIGTSPLKLYSHKFTCIPPLLDLFPLVKWKNEMTPERWLVCLLFVFFQLSFCSHFFATKFEAAVISTEVVKLTFFVWMIRLNRQHNELSWAGIESTAPSNEIVTPAYYTYIKSEHKKD